jgi:homoserine O-succinyltransferase
MPILIPEDLPAFDILSAERVFVMRQDAAARQDIRPLQVALLNLMPNKIDTETQILRVLGATPLQVEVTFLHPETYESKNTPSSHLDKFYQYFSDVKERSFDALIVTGAPVEKMPFEDVTYWNELSAVFEWAKRRVYSSFFLCWGAQAALNYYHGVPKYPLEGKKFGVYEHKVPDPYVPLIAGFDDVFGVPVSRHTEVRRADVEAIKGLDILAESSDSGVCLVHEPSARRVYMFNHLEYDALSLKREYMRDAGIDPDVGVPHNYFPNDDASREPRITWRAHRNLLFSNWLNLVYQGTPYDLGKLL